ncbi:hypothetical protein BT69DRAFT_1279124 [Atractiella rhizophila]|nr:hypothetical protein BT69DRAFT_1289792 [Atractiella rhizophila]KAH8926130.1 hypothetical protein BT69DRAFT_1279124 [Atractiella rhizophila]
MFCVRSYTALRILKHKILHLKPFLRTSKAFPESSNQVRLYSRGCQSAHPLALCIETLL